MAAVFVRNSLADAAEVGRSIGSVGAIGVALMMLASLVPPSDGGGIDVLICKAVVGVC